MPHLPRKHLPWTLICCGSRFNSGMGKKELLLLPVGQRQGWQKRSPQPEVALWSQTIGQDLQGEQQLPSKRLPKHTLSCQVLRRDRPQIHIQNLTLQAAQPFEAETHLFVLLWVPPNLQTSRHLKGSSPRSHSTSSCTTRSSTCKGLGLNNNLLLLAKDAMSTKHLRQEVSTATLKCQQGLAFRSLSRWQPKSFRPLSCRVITVNEIQDMGMLSQAPNKLWRQARLRT